MTTRKILLVQPQLSSLDGHEHTQISALGMMLPDDRIIVLTRFDFALADQMTGVEIYPVFPLLAKSGVGDRQGNKPHDSSDDSVRSKPPVPERYLSYVEALSAAVRRFEAGPADMLIVPSAGPDEIAVLVAFYEQLEDPQAPRAMLRLLSEDVVSGFPASFMERLHTCCRAGLLSLHTETTELRQRLEKQYGLAIASQFNLPCTIFADEVDHTSLSHNSHDEIKVGVLGRQRAEKGSYRIAGILKHLRQLAPRGNGEQKIRIVYQAVRSKRMRRLMIEVANRLSAGRNANVTIQYLESGMSKERFRQLLLDVDILLLPYDTKRYRYSGSGMIMDGVFALKPIVHSRGMAMQELLSHGNAESATSDREFAERILKIASNYYLYKQSTGAAAAYAGQLLDKSAEIFRI
ncbi:MAG: hypothetical protein P1V21_26720 [Rhizobiaceae bacterium]|nr:hypothetical protein [Rhizobiaceae bacterium]